MGETDLSCFAIIEFEVIAGLEIYGHSAVGMLLEVYLQHFLWHVKVIQLIVAQRHIYIQSEVVPATKLH